MTLAERTVLWLSQSYPKIRISPIQGDSRTNINGTPFLTICSGGIKEEGGRIPLLCSTDELAEETYRQALSNYIELNVGVEDVGVLYWRTLPEWKREFDYQRVFIWSRLVVEKGDK